jgi:uncharacterized surface protein with fasciclin (FAS1) repeats
MLKNLKSFAIAGLVLAAGLCQLAPAEAAKPTENIVQIAVSDPDLSVLVQALTDASLVKTLEGPGPFTVFAPTNSAFSKVPTELLDYFLANPAVLKQVLLYHVAAGADVLTPSPIKTVQGEVVYPSFSYGVGGLTVTVGNSVVTLNPIQATNGVIYLINSVLLPQF